MAAENTMVKNHLVLVFVSPRLPTSFQRIRNRRQWNALRRIVGVATLVGIHVVRAALNTAAATATSTATATSRTVPWHAAATAKPRKVFVR